MEILRVGIAERGLKTSMSSTQFINDGGDIFPFSEMTQVTGREAISHLASKLS